MFSSASIRKGKKSAIGSYAQEQERVMGEGYETINEFTQPALERFGEQYWEIMVSYSAFLVKYLNGNKMMREKAEMQKRLAWEEAMRERCRNNEADSHSGE